ncbi:MAG: glycosyltransferase [Patescibacteria group bacterium]|jgi:1,2-diacylglycerol 3-alpha-glucosyltransferase
MKIAIFSDTYFPQVNGVASVARQTAVNLSEAGHEVAVFTVSQEPEAELNRKLGNRFKVILLPSLPFWAYSDYRITLPASFSLKKVKKFQPDIIHVQTPFGAGWEGVLCSKLLKVPLVGTHHTFYDYYLKHIKLDYKIPKKLSWKYTAGFYNRCDLVLNPSRVLNDQLKENGLTKPSLVLPNPIDTVFFKPAATEEEKKSVKKEFGVGGRVVSYMGRVSYEKSIDQAIKAFSIASGKLEDAKMMIIGDGPERENLERLVKKLKLGDKVIFTSYLFGGQLLKALQAADVFITASKSENQPVSVLEAMACGLPIVAVSAEGLPEIVNDGKNGFLAKPDKPEEMAEKIILIMRDSKLKNKFSQNSREIALRFSNKIITEKLIGHYSSLLA